MKPYLSLSINNLANFDLYFQGVQQSNLKLKLPFVEILWDNYCHLEPQLILEYLSPFSDRIAFHIMWSKFLELEQEELLQFLQRLKYHIQVINPLYISDHLCQFKINNTHLFTSVELLYNNLDLVTERVKQYQDIIESQLLLENTASTSYQGKKQIEFFQKLRERTNCGIFFDISNARVAEKNGITKFCNWLDILTGDDQIYCHVGGYSYNLDDDLIYDSHDSNLTKETLADLTTVIQCLNIKTICYEREYQRTSEIIANELNLIEKALLYCQS